MAHILALSSWVAHGHVGLSAAAPVLQALGHTLTQLPTVQLSNHPGFAHVSGGRTDTDTLRAMIDALEDNGWIETADTILTGYLPSAAHVDVALALIDRFEGARPRIVVDPVLGDSPKGLYIAREAADAMRDQLVPMADVLTPNMFELSWLTNSEVRTLQSAAGAARDLAKHAPTAEILVTSAPFDGDRTGVLALTQSTTETFQVERAPQEQLVPKGVGDVYSALIAAGLPAGQALGHLQALIAQSLGAPHLRIAQTAAYWTGAKAIEPTAIDSLTGGGELR